MKTLFFILLVVFTTPIWGDVYYDEITVTSVTVDGETFDYENEYLGIEDYEQNSLVEIGFTLNLYDFNTVTLYFDSTSSTGIDETTGNSSLSFYVADSNNFMTDGTEGDRDIHLEVEYQNDLDQTVTASTEITLMYDTLIPDSPETLTLVPGDQNLKVKWDHVEDSSSDDHDEYKIYYKNMETGVEKSKTVSGTSTSATITDLENDVTYQVDLIAVDAAGNKGERLMTPVEGTPIAVNDFFEYYKEHNGGEDGGFCFVATAAYGSYDHGMVKLLRVFRDSFLAETDTGKQFILWYYENSPQFAKVIKNNIFLSYTVRVILEPIVQYISFTLYGSIYKKYLYILMLSLLLIYIKREKMVKKLSYKGVI